MLLLIYFVKSCTCPEVNFDCAKNKLYKSNGLNKFDLFVYKGDYIDVENNNFNELELSFTYKFSRVCENGANFLELNDTSIHKFFTMAENNTDLDSKVFFGKNLFVPNSIYEFVFSGIDCGLESKFI